MKAAVVGVTDWDWYQHLHANHATEVNFWQPSGGPRLKSLPPGGPFFFKSKYAQGNKIVGAGYFSGWASLPLSRAWEFFGETNGVASLAQLQAKIFGYRKRNQKEPHPDPEIGCVMLRDVEFFDPEDAWDAPEGWSSNIVTWAGYGREDPQTKYLEEVMRDLLIRGSGLLSDLRADVNFVPGPVFGAPHLTATRVGQGAFKALVQEAYGRRCAVTGDKIVPVLQAAHIRPVSDSGENRVDNGLLLRSDVHTLFDRGYISVHPQRKTLLVSDRLRSDWGNGEEFYARSRSGESIRMPRSVRDQPNGDYLTWHADTVFLAS